MVKKEIKWPVCGGIDVSKNGKGRTTDTQRYICNDMMCAGKSFMIDYSNNGSKPGIEKQIIDMTANGSGIRDISRVLEISTDKGLINVKKDSSVCGFRA